VGLEGLVKRMEAEEFDLIAVGRAILSDPHWVTKIKTGDSEALQPFDPASMAELV
jgi:2,4-dienoyl-CoA reductase-like NADH-dependent reductase (Old Yellow Enzyme family)